jgi:flagellar basal-body rod protein FlgB
MKPIYIFDVASRHNAWLAERQGLIAENVANASTTGFKARDLKPFIETLDETKLELAQTSKAHLTISPGQIGEPDVDYAAVQDATHSGNTVSLEREFGKAGDVGRAYSLNIGIMKAMNRMLLMSVKG